MKPTFFDNLLQYDWNEIANRIRNATDMSVTTAISNASNNTALTDDDIIALLSPAAAHHLEELATISRAKTQRRFGKNIQLYIPLYLSNYCTNSCTYCGFSGKNKINRKALTDAEILQEVNAIKEMGYEHILLVTGESTKHAGVDYLLNAINLIKPYFACISAEIQPLDTADYAKLIDAGLNAVYVYQETYNKNNYTIYHPAGKKSDFAYRLATPERLGDAGIYKIGSGALLGLENWQVEGFFLAQHLRFLIKHYWRSKYSISFPRIRPQVGGFEPKYPVSDKELAQLIWALRLFDEDVEISLTTRENATFRNNMLSLGITSMSAGSKTEPGGYATQHNRLEQWSINDSRSPIELVSEINKQNYSALWKDWDKFFVV
ncbi:MAG: 2-iminoacetate synthase ThiH [Ignavibacteria bacterium]|jgi:2-iminoacetate synthase|nr:2-iminoacetate synthase ThiH [Ignavibacteria bacterium]